MNFEIRRQQSLWRTVCVQFKPRASKIIQDLNSAFSPDKSMLRFRSSAQLLRGCSSADAKSRLRRDRPVYESSPLTSKEVYEMSHSLRQRRPAGDTL